MTLRQKLETLKPHELDLYWAILLEHERVLNLRRTRDYARDDFEEWWQRKRAIADLANGLGVKVSPTWIGQDPKSRQARRRGLLALQASGLVALSSANGSHATHVATIDDDEEATASPLPRPE